MEASWRLPEPSWRLLENLGGALGALGAVLGPGAILEAYKRRLGDSLGCLGAVLGAVKVILEPYGELPRQFWTRPDSSWQHLADLLNFLFSR